MHKKYLIFLKINMWKHFPHFIFIFFNILSHSLASTGYICIILIYNQERKERNYVTERRYLTTKQEETKKFERKLKTINLRMTLNKIKTEKMKLFYKN